MPIKPARFILAIDQGTTGSRAILYNSRGQPAGSGYREFRQYYPKPGWVEHDPEEIVSSVRRVMSEAMRRARVSPRQIAAVGITNQRETTVLWDRRTGRSVRPAIVWQDRRTEEICQRLKRFGHEARVQRETGLLLDPYFSGTKLRWVFERDQSLHRKARSGSLAFGTIDSWLLYQLTGRQVHATDFTNASRTLLFDIQHKRWSPALCRLLHVPEGILPEVKRSGGLFGKVSGCSPLQDGTPIYAMIGDQQSALFGQGCYRAGEGKSTYGTGCFMLVHTGKHLPHPHSGLLATMACDRSGGPAYALEGSIFIGGAAIQWLRDGLKIIRKAAETEAIARRTPQSDEVVVVPAFTGLGAPYWRADVRGAIFGLTRGTTQEMIVKATLDAIAIQVREVFDLMRREAKVRISALKVDGGATSNGYLMQRQADLLGAPVLRTALAESTAWGAAKLAGLASGVWPDLGRIDREVRYTRFSPRMSHHERDALMQRWHQAIKRLLA